MTKEEKNNSKTFEEEVKSWQEVYAIDPDIVVDLSRESHISYEGNTVLLNDDQSKEVNTRKAKSLKSDLDIIDVEVTPENNQDKIVAEENTLETKKGIGARFRELMGIVKVEQDGQQITVHTITQATYKSTYDKDSRTYYKLNDEIIEGDIRELKENSHNNVQDKIKSLRIPNDNTENKPKLK